MMRDGIVFILVLPALGMWSVAVMVVEYRKLCSHII